MGSLDGCHVVTVEALAAGGALHPVQQAMVAHHGSQCGFCTPGFVMSLYALWMRKPDASVPQIEKALQGNLCRCTGYAPIIRAAQAAAEADPAGDPLLAERGRVTAALKAMRDGARVSLGAGRDRLILPADVADLAALRAELPDATHRRGRDRRRPLGDEIPAPDRAADLHRASGRTAPDRGDACKA